MITIGETRRFDNTAFVTREPHGPEVTRTNMFSCIYASDDPLGFGMEIRALPFPNPCKPASAGLSWFSRQEWEKGTIISKHVLIGKKE